MYRARIFGPDGRDGTPYKLQNSEELRMSHLTGVNKSRNKRKRGEEETRNAYIMSVEKREINK